jgi:hypothetical protein
MTEGPMRVRRATRLRVLSLLPQRHQDHFFAEMRRLCASYVASLGVPATDREAEARELLSEVIAKLLGAASLPAGEEGAKMEEAAMREQSRPDGEVLSPLPDSWTIEDQDPGRDERVMWLIAETGGRRALSHRYEDMRRQRWGRWQPTGYRVVQVSALHRDEQAGSESDDDVLARHADASHPLHAEPEDPQHGEETRRAWLGLLATAGRQFSPGDDVSLLLGVLAGEAEVQAGFGSEWPVAAIVGALNRRHPHPPWTDDRVENAKKRLKNWIGRLKRDRGLDSTDLRGLFVRVAREHEGDLKGSAAVDRDRRT